MPWRPNLLNISQTSELSPISWIFSCKWPVAEWQAQFFYHRICHEMVNSQKTSRAYDRTSFHIIISTKSTNMVFYFKIMFLLFFFLTHFLQNTQFILFGIKTDQKWENNKCQINCNQKIWFKIHIITFTHPTPLTVSFR